MGTAEVDKKSFISNCSREASQDSPRRSSSGKRQPVFLPKIIQIIDFIYTAKQDICVHTTTRGSQKVHLVEVPSFINGDDEDSVWFQDLTYWLVMSYKDRGIKLSGIVYVCHVADPSIDDDVLYDSVRVFSEICGPNFYPSVVLARAAPSGRGKKSTLPKGRLDTQHLWDHMVESGATKIQLPWNIDSATSTLAHLVDKGRRMPLQLQSEIVICGLPLHMTSAGAAVNHILQKPWEVSTLNMHALPSDKASKYSNAQEATGRTHSRMAKDRLTPGALEEARKDFGLDLDVLMPRVQGQHVRKLERWQHEIYLSETRLLEFEASCRKWKPLRETELEQAREDYRKGGQIELQLRVTQKPHDLHQQLEEALAARRGQHRDLQAHISHHAAWQEIMFKWEWEKRQQQTATEWQHHEKGSKTRVGNVTKEDDAFAERKCSVM